MTTAPSTTEPDRACAVCGAWVPEPRYAVRDLLWGAPGTWTFATCAQCGHGTLTPLPSPAELAALYAGLWTPENIQAMETVGNSPFEAGLQRARLHRIQAALGDRTPRRIVDVGCGLGHFLRRFADAHPDAHCQGVEVAPQAADRARARGLEVLRQPFHEADIPPASCDVVSLMHFLEHQPDPAADLRRAADLLVDGGILAVELPQLDGWGRTLLRHWYWPHLPPQHLQVFNRAGLGRVLEALGFTPIDWRTASYPFLLSTTLVLGLRYTVGSRSPHARRWWIRGPAFLLGLLALVPCLAWDLVVGPLAGILGRGDILLVVARRNPRPA